jgi:hypothetical protein
MVEDTKLILLQAQLDYWKEMIACNAKHIAVTELQAMKRHLLDAQKEVAAYTTPRLTLVA